MEKLVEMKNITKEFPGVVALSDINLDLFAGEVHVLMGENGAGKSTLMKILSGVYTPTRGEIIVHGKSYSSLTPTLSKENGIGIIYQELSVINELSIAENLFVGRLPTRKILGVPVVEYKYINQKAKEMLALVGLKQDPSRIVEELPISEKQLVEIAKALVCDTRILIMDEPTSSLTMEETDNLFKIIKNLQKSGVGIIYISHKMDEVKKVGDRITVLKDGKHVATKKLTEIKSKEEIATMMVGRELKDKFLRTQKSHECSDEIIFSAKNITRYDKKVRDVSFDLYKNEILGFAGLVGSGRTELMNVIFGVEKMERGKVYLKGKELKVKNTYDAVRKELAYLTENRRETGFFHNFEIWKNIAMIDLLKNSRMQGVYGLTNTKKERSMANAEAEQLSVKCTSINQNITELSGGNQQKVIVAKWLAAKAEILIFDEPTKGIDIGAKSEIYKIMRTLAEQGKGVLMISSELPELLSVCDRIVVFNEGEIRAIFNSDEATEEKIIISAT